MGGKIERPYLFHPPIHPFLPFPVPKAPGPVPNRRVEEGKDHSPEPLQEVGIETRKQKRRNQSTPVVPSEGPTPQRPQPHLV